jgi:hypothetical protein
LRKPLRSSQWRSLPWEKQHSDGECHWSVRPGAGERQSTGSAAAYAKGAWREAFKSLSSADRATPLDAEDLGLLARAAYMLGRDDDYVGGLERAHHAHLEAREVAPAVRCAFRIGPQPALPGRARASERMVAFALKELTATEETRIVALVKKAMS